MKAPHRELPPLAQRCQIAKVRIMEKVTEVVCTVQIHYCNLIALHPNTERIAEQGGVYRHRCSFQRNGLQKITVSNGGFRRL